MLLVLGILLIVAAGAVIAWARPRAGQNRPAFVESEFGSMLLCIGIIIMLSAGLSLAIRQFV